MLSLWLVYLLVFAVIDMGLIVAWFVRRSERGAIIGPLLLFSTVILIYAVLNYYLYQDFAEIYFGVLTLIAGFALITLFNNILQVRLTEEQKAKYGVMISLIDVVLLICVVVLVILGFILG